MIAQDTRQQRAAPLRIAALHVRQLRHRQQQPLDAVEPCRLLRRGQLRDLADVGDRLFMRARTLERLGIEDDDERGRGGDEPQDNETRAQADAGRDGQ